VGHAEIGIEDFAGMNGSAIKDKIADDFGIARSDLDAIEIVVAYMSVGSWGCDSSAFIVFRKDGVLYEVNGSHCSCYGFSESSVYGGSTQWEPEPVETVDAILKRKDYALAGGGYDSDQAGNAAKIRALLERAK
jgi:hypothetical protein